MREYLKPETKTKFIAWLKRKSGLELLEIIHIAIEVHEQLFRGWVDDNVGRRFQYIRENQPIKAFIKECLQTKPGALVAKNQVYEAYLQFCKENDFLTVNRRTFKLRLSKILPWLKGSSVRRTINGKYRYVYRNVMIVCNL